MLIVFDVEGVLVDGEYLPELAKMVGKKEEVEAITLRGIRGEIMWEEGLTERVNLLRGIKRKDAVKVANGLKLMKNAKKAFKWIKKAGLTTVGISGGFYIVLNRVKDALGLDYIFANEMVFNDEELVDIKLNVNSDKTEKLVALMKRLGAKEEKMIAVVDGANDLDLFKMAGLKIAFNAQTIVKQHADVVIDIKDLLRIIPPIKETFDIC